MSFHIVDIGSSPARLTCRDGSLRCEFPNGVKSLPLEDVGSIVVTAFEASFSSALLVEAAKAGVSLVLCQQFKPVSVLLPVNRSSDTLLTRAQFSLSSRQRAQLWRATVDAKCSNQVQAAINLGAEDRQISVLRRCAAGNKPFKEANCARQFWSLFARLLDAEDFRRRPRTAGINSLLNYGYAVLLSVVLQRLMAVGIDPTWGIAHKQRERSVALAYDLMEPFRPLIDERVGLWIRRHEASVTEMNAACKTWLTETCQQKVPYRGTLIPVIATIEAVIRSFRRAISSGQPGLYKPWTSTNIKWAG